LFGQRTKLSRVAPETARLAVELRARPARRLSENAKLVQDEFEVGQMW
jgi:hypothetical protein